MKPFIAFLLILLSYVQLFGQTDVVEHPSQPSFYTVICKGEGRLFNGVKKSDYEKSSELKIVGKLNEKDFQKLTKLKNLRTLDLSEAEFSNGSEEILKAMQQCINVETVYLSNIIYELPFPSLKNIVVRHLDIDAMKMEKQKWSPYCYYGINGIKDIESITYTKASGLLSMERGASYAWYRPRYLIGKNTGTIINNCDYSTPPDYSKEVIFLKKPYGDTSIETVPDVLDLRKATFIGDYVFSGCSMSKVILSSDIKYIGQYAFAGCENLKEVVIKDGRGNTAICPNAFRGCTSLERFTFGTNANIARYAFDKLHTVIFKNDVEAQDLAFEKIQFAEFSTVPSKLSASFVGETRFSSIEPFPVSILIPRGTSDKFINMGFKASQITDGEPNLEYNITLEQGGTILSQLPLNDLTRIKSLTITGILYETDFQIISKCTNLENLDISRTFSTLSPEKTADRNAARDILAGLFSMMSSGLDAQYENKEIGTGSYMSSKIIAELSKDAYSVEANVPSCHIPYNTINNLKKLKTLILPLRANYIDGANFNGCCSLEHIEWPLFLEKIGSNCFNRCTSLKEVVLPASLKYLADDSFLNCSSLKKVDLSRCTFTDTTWDATFDGCFSNFELHLPQGILYIGHAPRNGSRDERYRTSFVIYFPACIKAIYSTYDYSELHFAGKQAPTARQGGSLDYPRNCKIYVPKGSLTSYYANFGGDEEGNQYYEE